MHPAWEQPSVQIAAPSIEPVSERAACLRGNFELHGAAGLLLDNRGAPFQRAGRHDVRQPQRHNVAASQLAIQGNVEQRQVTHAALDLKAHADRPDVHGSQGQLGPNNARQRGWRVHGRLRC